MPPRRRVEILSLAAILAAVAVLGLLFIDRHLDRSFITYRTARNLSAGEGLTYNPGEPTLSSAVSPLYAALLAGGTQISADLPRLSNLIGIAAIAAGAIALFVILHPSGPLMAAGAALIYASFPLLWLGLGLETTLWMALGLLAVMAHERGWGLLTGLLLALGILTRPEMAALAAVLVAEAVLTGRKFNPLALTAFGVVLAGGLLGLSTVAAGSGAFLGLPQLGSVIAPDEAMAPDVLAGLGRFAIGLFTLSPLWAAAGLLALLGVLRLPEVRGALLLVGWGLLHLAVLLILGTAVDAWHFAPLAPPIAALAALGVQWAALEFKGAGLSRPVTAIGALLIAAAVLPSLLRLTLLPVPAGSAWRALSPATADPAYAQAGLWLRQNVPADTPVGAGQIGVLGFNAAQPIVDSRGRLQDNVAASRERGDPAWWLAEYTPEVLVLGPDELADARGTEPGQQSWFDATYSVADRVGPAGEVAIYRRSVDPLPFTEHMVGMVSYPNGAILNSIATDFELDPLEGGRGARVRLEWMLSAPLAAPQYVAIAIEGREGAVTALDEHTVDFSGWPVRRLATTFHNLTLGPAPTPGVYDIRVGIGTDPLDLTWQDVATAKVPFPSAVLVGGVSGARAEFGDVALGGYRLANTPDGLDVLLVWQALRQPTADYHVLVQVRDGRGEIVEQREAEPHDGAYPTSVWDSGEEVADSYLIDTANLPPGEYEVTVGLLDADGDRLITVDGRDAVTIGVVSIDR